MTRPDLVLAVVGTGTEVGKTWVGARLIRELRNHGAVAARKPVQSFDEGDTETDADHLAEASGESPDTVCAPHRWYPVAMAPPMAAAALDLPPFGMADLSRELSFPDSVAFGLVEGAGGVASPLAADGDNADFVRVVAPDGVILVADAGLGTINAVRLCVRWLDQPNTVVYLNRFDVADDLHAQNKAWLAERDGFAVETDVRALAERCLRWCRQFPDQNGRA